MCDRIILGVLLGLTLACCGVCFCIVICIRQHKYGKSKQKFVYYIPQVNSPSAEDDEDEGYDDSDDEGKQGMGALYGKSGSDVQLPSSASSSSVNGGDGSSIL